MNFRNKAIPILVFSFVLICFVETSSRENNIQIKLADVLEKGSEYCEKLEKAAFNFVSNEKIIEIIDITDEWAGRDQVLKLVKDLPGAWGPSKKIKKNTFIYDYQLIKKGGRTKETRILLEENGKEKYEKNAKLKTHMFYYEKPIFGPIGLLSEYWQNYHDYKILGEVKLKKKKAIVIEAIPNSSLKENPLYGKIWIDKNNFSILKIEWQPESMRDFKIIEETAKKYKSMPKITFISEYDIEKNGINFPTKVFIREAYLGKKGKFIKSETTIIYENYKFFTVETEIKY